MIKYEDVFSHYGIIKITGGKYKGRFAYYDDDDTDDDGIDKAVVYFGDILYNSYCEYIDYKYIDDNYTFDDLKKRSDEIIGMLLKNINDNERTMLVEEKNMIDMEIISHLENFIELKNINDKKIFLSHSSIDKSIVISVALDLEKRGLIPWVDAFDILPGESIVNKINEGLNNCDFVLLFLSKNSIKSNWVLKEWETMMWDEINSGKIKIIPIKLDDCEIPKILQTKKYIDLSKDYDTGIFQIISAIKQYNNMK